MIYPFESSVFLIKRLPTILAGALSSFKRIAFNALLIFASALVVWFSGVSGWFVLPLFALLWLASVVDAFEHVVPDILTILIFCVLIFSDQRIYLPEFVVSAAVLLTYKTIVEPKLRKEFLGWGDVKLLMVLFLFLPLAVWPMFLGGVGCVFLLVALGLQKRSLPMFPFIAAAFWVSFLLKKM